MTKPRFMRCSTLAARSCRSLFALVERDDGRPLAGLGEPLAGDACRSACGLRLSLARRVCVDRARSTAGSACSGGICAGSAGCSTPWFAPMLSSPAAFATAASTMPKRCRWASRRACSRRRCVRRRCASRRSARSASTPSATLARRHRPFLGGEALGHGAARRRGVPARRRGRDAAGRRRSQRAEAGNARGPDHARRGAAARSPTATSSPACWQAPMRWCMAAKPRLSAWLPPRRVRAASR